MQPRLNFALFLFLFLLGKSTIAFPDTWPFSSVYKALRSNDTVEINAQLESLEKTTLSEKDAYTGALMMKLADLLKSGLEKLSTFKNGRVKLEQSIRKDSLNAEYRFLRLVIQENVPDFLNYHSKKAEDGKIIRESFGKLPKELQDVIRDYSKDSRILKPEDFKK